MDELTRLGRRYQRQREAAEATHAQLVVLILEARRTGMTLRAIADATGLSFARIHQITREPQP